MRRVLVAWEDLNFRPLEAFVKRRLAHRSPHPMARFPEVIHHTSKGNGGFKRYVGSTWASARAKGMPGNAGAIDHLVCVLDGDRLPELLPQVSRPPSEVGELAVWHERAELLWQEHLRSLGGDSPAQTVHGRVLRWSKESLLLAGYDQAPFVDHLGTDADAPGARAFLDKCVPVPAGVAAGVFTDTYRKPLVCIHGLQEALGKSLIDKNDPDVDDALFALAKSHSPIVSARVPDIDRLVDLIWTLAGGSLEAGPATGLAARSL